MADAEVAASPREWLKWRHCGARLHARGAAGRTMCGVMIPASAVPGRGRACGRCVKAIAEGKCQAIPKRLAWAGAQCVQSLRSRTLRHPQHVKRGEE